MEGASIIFPHLGITIEHLGKNVSIFGFEIAYYGIIIGIGMIIAISFIIHEAKRTGQDSDTFYDLCLICIILGIIGARAYYVFFEWDYYSQYPAEIINLRGGGLAIYGGIITGVIVLIIFTKLKNMKTTLVMDTIIQGVVIGQFIGRWGNFCNREAFGGFSDGLLAMQIRMDEAAYTTQELVDKAVTVNGVQYIQVQPTFLYESLWNIGVFIILQLYKRHKKFDGEIFLLYFFFYGIGRFIIEGFRTDQLLLPVIGLPVSQILSACFVIISLTLMLIKRIQLKKEA